MGLFREFKQSRIGHTDILPLHMVKNNDGTNGAQI